MHFADQNAGRPVLLQDLVLVLEHHGGVADVVADPQVAPHPILVAAGEQVFAEEAAHVIRGVESATGFGLEVEVEQFARVEFSTFQFVNHAQQVLRGACKVGGVRQLRTPAERQGRDAALAAFGQQTGENLSQVQGIAGPLCGAPGWAVDLVLDDRLVEIAMWKAVEGVCAQAVVVQPIREAGDILLFDNVAGAARREPQSHTEMLRRAHLGLHRQCVALQVVANLLP